MYENNSLIAEDIHLGEAGNRHRNNQYRLPLKSFNPQSTYKVEVEFHTDGGTDSYGEFYLQKSEYLEPDAEVETNIYHRNNYKPSNIINWYRKTYFFSDKPVRKDDYIKIVFKEPVPLKRIVVNTGRSRSSEYLIVDGVLEISEDGDSFSSLTPFSIGKAESEVNRNVKAIRIKALADHEKEIIVRDIKLY